jgi:hypothetical protein
VKAVVADLGEAGGEDVVEEAADEDLGQQRDGPTSLGGEADARLVEGLDTLVGDGHAVSALLRKRVRGISY